MGDRRVRYNIVVLDEHEKQFIELIKDTGHYEGGLWWPGYSTSPQTYNFELELEEDELLMIMLKVPCKLYKPKPT